MNYSYDKVKSMIENITGYKLQSPVYIRSNQKMNICCPNNHLFDMTLSSFNAGHRCPLCHKNKITPTIDIISQKAIDIGYTLLSSDYIHAKSKLNFICDKNHKFSMNWNNFKSGQKCPICNGGVVYQYNNIKNHIETSGYIIHSTTYKNSGQKLLLQCNKGHMFKMCFNKFQQGRRCPICSIQHSKPEKEVLNFIKTFYTGIIKSNDRKTIYNYWTNKWLELDIYLPEINKAIEYNGYYHTTTDVIKWRDMIKEKRCKQLNINLLVIDDNDWHDNKEIIKQKLMSFVS